MSTIEKDILTLRFRIISKVKTILDNILIEVSTEEKAVIICNIINEMSLDLLYNGASAKPHYINAQTQKSSILGGFIIVEDDVYNNLDKKIISIKGLKEYFFYYNNNVIVPTDTLRNDISYIHGLADKNNMLITSDLDILAITMPSNVDPTPLSESYSMGNILKYEYDIVSKINNLFSKYIFGKNNRIERKTTEIVKHGPFNRYHKTKLEDIYFPIAVYHPLRGKFFVGSESDRDASILEFLTLLTQLQKENYDIHIHPSWSI